MYTKNEQDEVENTELAIGRSLKRARDDAAVSIQDIADRTRLSQANLVALEAGDFERLPGVGYIPGYIRNYCHAVGVDAAPYISNFKALSNDVTKKPEYSFPVQALVPRVAGSMVAMFTVLIGLAVYVGWTVLSYNKSSDDKLIASSISQSQQPVELIESEIANQYTEPVAETIIATQPAEGTPSLKVQPVPSKEETKSEPGSSQRLPLAFLPSGSTSPEVISPAQESQTAVVTADGPPNTVLSLRSAPAGVAALATARVPEKEVVIRATASAWIEIARADGEVMVTRLMRDGDELVLSTKDVLFLSTGNAGGLRLEMLNLSAFDAGQTGEILRDLRLNRESLLTRKTQLAF